MALLLTGATGLLGGALWPILREQKPDRQLIVLVRSEEKRNQFLKAGMEAVLGDISLPRLGLTNDAYDSLAGCVTEIIHGAADVRFDLSLAAARSVNLFGTRQMLDFADALPKLEKYLHVSTAFVNGYRAGALKEAPLPPGHKFINTYQQSKFEAEGLVLKAMERMPTSMYRLSMVIADSGEGVVSQFNYFHHLLRHVPGSPLPVVPGDPEAPADLVTNDFAASALAFLFDYRFQAGAILHLCAGPERSMKLGEVIERTCAQMEARQPEGRKNPVRAPQLVSLEAYDRYLSRCGSEALRKVAGLLGESVRLMAVRQPILNDLTQKDLEGSGISLPDMRDCLERTVSYCLDTDWGRNSLAGMGAGGVLKPRPAP